MRLHHCTIGHYRVLRNLQIKFNNTDNERLGIDFLVGQNGSGKSTLLQAITFIIQQLEKGSDVPFRFHLEYELGSVNAKQSIRIYNYELEGDTEQKDLIRTRADTRTATNGWQQRLGSLEEILPRVIILTTGREQEWQALLESSQQGVTLEPIAMLSGSLVDPKLHAQHEQRLLSERIGAPIVFEPAAQLESQKITFVPTEALPLVTLCGVLAELSHNGTLNSMKAIFEDVRIRQVCAFSLRFRLNLAGSNERREIQELAQKATRAVHIGSDWLLFFDLTNQQQSSIQDLLGDRGGAFAFYQQLRRLSKNTIAAERVLQEVNIFVKRGLKDEDPVKDREIAQNAPLHPLAWLSDGERSFIGRMSLFSMLRDQDQLILLDEPEVHFNDYWKRQIVDRLATLLEDGKCHALITSHSSITLTDVPREDIIVLHRGEQYTKSAGSPTLKTLAADPSDIIIHVFDSPYATGQYAVKKVKAVLDEVGQRNDKQAHQKLKDLLNEVGPGYWSYRIRRELTRFGK